MVNKASPGVGGMERNFPPAKACYRALVPSVSQEDGAVGRRTKAPSAGGQERPAGLHSGSSAPHYRERTLEQTVGAQVRAQRHRLGLTGGEVARAASISPGMLSKIENGQISASLGTLQALSQALGMPLTAFFAPFEERRDCSFVRSGQGVTIERRGTKSGHRYQLLGHSLAGNIVVEPYLITLSREAKPYAAFQHEGLELIYMLTGRVTYRHGEDSYELRPGDTLFFDPNAPHGPEVLHELPMTYLSIIIYARP